MLPIGLTVGPLAITFRSSPITSERMKDWIGTGFTIVVKPPPFNVDIDWRIKFISEIHKSEDNNNWFTSILSRRVNPRIGAGNKAEAPPLINKINVSLRVAFCKIPVTFFPAFMPFLSGMGWLAPITSHSLINW